MSACCARCMSCHMRPPSWSWWCSGGCRRRIGSTPRCPTATTRVRVDVRVCTRARANLARVCACAKQGQLAGGQRGLSGAPSSTHPPTPPVARTGDDEIGVLAQYYHTPWFATRSLMWDEWAWNSSVVVPNWMQEENHPNTLGHRRARTGGAAEGRASGSHGWLDARMLAGVGGNGAAALGQGARPSSQTAELPGTQPCPCATLPPSSHPPAGTWLT